MIVMEEIICKVLHSMMAIQQTLWQVKERLEKAGRQEPPIPEEDRGEQMEIQVAPSEASETEGSTTSLSARLRGL